MKVNKVIRISEKIGVEYSAIGKLRHTFPNRSHSLETFERKSAHLETSVPHRIELKISRSRTRIPPPAA